MRRWFSLFVILSGLTGPLAAASFKADQLVVVEQESLAKKIEDKKLGLLSFYLVDLRNEAEYRKGWIPGAINIPMAKLKFLAEKTFGPADEVIFYGHSEKDPSGGNSVIFMVNKGYTRVAWFREGMQGWKGEVAVN